MFYKLLIFISAFSFIFYSIRSIYSKRMKSEFSRWGFNKLRLFISFGQFFAAFALIFGFYNINVLVVASFFLFIMMICAIIVRVKINDTLTETFPAIFFAILNFIIFYFAFIQI